MTLVDSIQLFSIQDAYLSLDLGCGDTARAKGDDPGPHVKRRGPRHEGWALFS